MIPALLLTLIGWALAFLQITLPIGLGTRLQAAPIAGLLAAAYAGAVPSMPSRISLIRLGIRIENHIPAQAPWIAESVGQP